MRPRELTVTATVTVTFALDGLMDARPNEATVAELLAMVRGMLDDERTRGQGLDGKSATLAGFTGTILALTATLGAELLDLDLGSVGSAVFQCLYMISVVALGVGLAGRADRRPATAAAARAERWTRSERFSEFPLIAQPPVEVQGTMMNTLIEALAHERALNERKARLTRVAAVCLAVGFVGVAAQAVTLGIAA